MEPLFDSHAHYYDSRFAALEGGADALLEALFREGVGYIINVGTDPNNSKTVIAEAARWQGMYATVGIHPGDCQWIDHDKVEGALDEIERLVMHREAREQQKIVALGEENIVRGQSALFERIDIAEDAARRDTGFFGREKGHTYTSFQNYYSKFVKGL